MEQTFLKGEGGSSPLVNLVHPIHVDNKSQEHLKLVFGINIHENDKPIRIINDIYSDINNTKTI